MPSPKSPMGRCFLSSSEPPRMIASTLRSSRRCCVCAVTKRTTMHAASSIRLWHRARLRWSRCFATLPTKAWAASTPKLEAIDQQMRPIYTRHGFSVRFGSAQPPQPGWMRITCTVAHESGYYEENYLDSPVSNQGAQGGRMAMTQVQAIGSVVTYLRRYLLGMVFNIVQADVVGDDDDGEGQRGAGSGENMRAVAADIARSARITERAEDYEAPPKSTSHRREPGWQDFIKALSLALNDAQDWEEVDRILCGERVMKAKAAFKDIALQELNKLIVATLQKWEPKQDDMASDQDEVLITGEHNVMAGD